MIEVDVIRKTPKNILDPKFIKWLEPALAETAFDGQAHAVKTLVAHGRTDTGFLIGHIDVDLTKLSKGEIRVHTEVPYAPPVEFGAGPSGETKTAGWWPPEEPIKRWVSRKLGKHGKELEQITWSIRNAIHKRGIVPTPFMRPAADFMKSQLAKKAAKVMGRAFKEELGPLVVQKQEAH